MAMQVHSELEYIHCVTLVASVYSGLGCLPRECRGVNAQKPLVWMVGRNTVILNGGRTTSLGSIVTRERIGGPVLRTPYHLSERPVLEATSSNVIPFLAGIQASWLVGAQIQRGVVFFLGLAVFFSTSVARACKS